MLPIALLDRVQRGSDKPGNNRYPRSTEKEITMKNLIKLSAICSVLIIAGLLICSCGGGGSTENFVQGNGKITVTVKDNGGSLLSNVKIEVHADSAAGKIVDTWTTDATGTHDFQESVASSYFFTFTDLTVPARFASPQNWPSQITPSLTSTIPLSVTLI
jgi:hypothetical protein